MSRREQMTEAIRIKAWVSMLEFAEPVFVKNLQNAGMTSDTSTSASAHFGTSLVK